MPLGRTNDHLLRGETAFFSFFNVHMDGDEYIFLISYRFYICGIPQQHLFIVSMSQRDQLPKIGRKLYVNADAVRKCLCACVHTAEGL